MKIISAHQPAYIPWLGYYHKLILSDTFVIMDDVQYEKNSFINRNKLLINGTDQWLTIPVKTKDYKSKTIKDIEILDSKWKKKHLLSIEQNYKKQAFFCDVMSIMERNLKQDSNYLIDYTNHFLFESIEYLELNTELMMASQLNITEKKLQYVIELTQKLEGDVFIFGAQGRNYAKEEVLIENGINPYFQDFQQPKYDQNQEEFVPYLSILDAMFRLGKKTKSLITEGNLSKKELYYD